MAKEVVDYKEKVFKDQDKKNCGTTNENQKN